MITTLAGTPIAHDAATVASIDAVTAIALRRTAIRPDDPDDAMCRYLGDDDATALHLGLIVGGIAVGAITCVPDPLILGGVVYPWRRRGFCILPAHRGGGLGRWFYSAFLAEITARAMTPAWGTSREALVPFYASFGLRPTENVVEFAGTGLHRVCLYS
ncbi:GNAT superfamily N-acetyltransferase [Mycobacterium frederiksbergense]|uniref:GNAT superfamily N-acetyltransferase n=1 Tax=Mycolicibacterium frederiksbergense TaxID=117567 RepID=A0ABT6L3C2_9MYCO|nr:hypothetical protein [Mycolicibacterium frederiksbergense]MDH6197131.1 GNAT superfamily N-acetyltransferase [Mycolicibacterium frederiksbergense]